MTRALIYARVSSETQRDNHTIDSQLRVLPAWVKDQRFDLVETVIDNGITGKNSDDRPGWTRVMQLVTARAFDVLVVVHFNRCTRSPDEVERAVIIKTLRENKVKLGIPQAGGLIDLENNTQNLMISITGSFSSYEGREILEKTAAGRVTKLLNGGRNGCRDPYGFRWQVSPTDRTRGAYVHVPEEVEAIKMMVDHALDGRSIVSIMEALDKSDYPRNHAPENKREKWCYQKVRRILHSRTIMGEFGALGGKHTIAVPPVIDEETFLRLQAAIDGRKTRTFGSPRLGAGTQLLIGLLRCGICDYGMWLTRSSSETERKRHYYRCNAATGWRRLQLPGPCPNRGHRTDVIDALVWDRLKEILQSPKAMQVAASLRADEAEENRNWRADIVKHRKRLSALEALVEETNNRRRRELLDAAQCDMELLKIKRAREELNRQIALAESQLVKLAGAPQWFDRIEEFAATTGRTLEKLDFAERRALVERLVQRPRCWVEINRDGSVRVRCVLTDGAESLPMEFTAQAKQSA